MDIQPIDKLGASDNIMVIDLDTGTVLGTNLVLVYVPYPSIEEICSSDSAAFDYGKRHGYPLLVDVDYQ
jgi:hypothetical protein